VVLVGDPVPIGASNNGQNRVFMLEQEGGIVQVGRLEPVLYVFIQKKAFKAAP